MTWLEKTERQRRVAFPTTQDQDILAVMEVARDRSSVYEDLFTRIISTTESFPELLCSDDVTSLLWAVEHLNLPSIVMQHLHEPPYDRILLFWKASVPSCGCQYRLFLGVPNSFTVKAELMQGTVMIHHLACELHECQCKPSLCIDGSCHPLCRSCSWLGALARTFTRWRSCFPLQVFSQGLAFAFEARGADRPPRVLDEPWHHFPEELRVLLRSWVFSMLRVTWLGFRGIHVTNDPSETSNSRMKHRLPRRGRPAKDRKHHRRRVFLRWAAKWRRHHLRRLFRRVIATFTLRSSRIRQWLLRNGPLRSCRLELTSPQLPSPLVLRTK